MDIVDRWNKVAEGFTARVDAVREDQWENATPCSEWNVRQLVEHAIGSQRMLPERLGVDLPAADDDPKAPWPAIREAALAAYRVPGALDQTVQMPFGEMTVGQMLTNIATGDLLVHTWDLARATGGDERLEPDAVAAVYEGLKPLDKIVHASPTVFGPKVEPPPGADLQTELLCFTGRRH